MSGKARAPDSTRYSGATRSPAGIESVRAIQRARGRANAELRHLYPEIFARLYAVELEKERAGD